MLNYTRHLLPMDFIKKIAELCYLMTTPDLSKRYTVEEAADFLENALSLLSL
jgi:hypothetical protein